MDINRQDRYERSLKEFKLSLNGNYKNYCLEKQNLNLNESFISDNKDITTDMVKLKKAILKYLKNGYVFR